MMPDQFPSSTQAILDDDRGRVKASLKQNPTLVVELGFKCNY